MNTFNPKIIVDLILLTTQWKRYFNNFKAPIKSELEL